MTSDIPPWAGAVGADTLARLLALQGERDWLDYKSRCDLSLTRDVVEITKDIGAMMIAGGYIVVGADDNGQPAGEAAQLDLFDPATVHAKVAKYLPDPFEIRVARHPCGNQSYAVIYVAPHAAGFCVFECDGNYTDSVKGTRTVFRAGDVFARHGTRSERWNQRDIAEIKQRLQADADRGRDQDAEALALIDDISGQLGGSGLWLAVAVVPEYRLPDPPKITPDAAQRFLAGWSTAQAPVEAVAQGTATYRQPGGVVITSQAGTAEPPYWWRLGLHDGGDTTGAYVLAHEVAADPASSDTHWLGLPPGVGDGMTIPARRDDVEVRLEMLLDVLTAYAIGTDAGGRAVITAVLLTPHRDKWVRIALLDEVTDDSEQHTGWRLASGRAHQPMEAVVKVPVTGRVQLADMRDARLRLQAASRLAADLLALFGVDRPAILRPDGTLDPYGAAVSRQQPMYEHARHLGLPVDDISPGERRRKFEEGIAAAKNSLRQR